MAHVAPAIALIPLGMVVSIECRIMSVVAHNIQSGCLTVALCAHRAMNHPDTS
jgi:hypothetical protein